MKFIILGMTLQLLIMNGFTQEITQQKNQEVGQPLQDPDLKIFTDLAKDAGIRDLFEGTGPFTVFAPSNEAFQKFGEEKLKNLKKPQNQDALADLIFYHVLPGKYMSNTLKSMTVTTLEGRDLQITVDKGEIRINNAKVIRKDMIGRNGVIYEIDTVLVP